VTNDHRLCLSGLATVFGSLDLGQVRPTAPQTAGWPRTKCTVSSRTPNTKGNYPVYRFPKVAKQVGVLTIYYNDHDRWCRTKYRLYQFSKRFIYSLPNLHMAQI